MYYLVYWQESLQSHFKLRFKAYLKRINLHLEKKRQRRQLINLSDHLLDDIGVTRVQAIEEAKK